MAEQEWQKSQRDIPADLSDVGLVDLGLLPQSLNSLDEEPHIHNAADLALLSDEQLLKIEQIGVGAVRQIRAACNHWLQRIAAG